MMPSLDALREHVIFESVNVIVSLSFWRLQSGGRRRYYRMDLKYPIPFGIAAILRRGRA
jgi:hypothetical protein